MGGSRYENEIRVTSTRIGAELGFVKIRYKLPKSDTSRLITTPINASVQFASFDQAPRDARFAVAVAGFAELLRGGRYTGALSYDDVLRIATASRGPDQFGYRSEFIQLVKAAESARSLAKLER
jgi:Ca-activated chloride channel family protein